MLVFSKWAGNKPACTVGRVMGWGTESSPFPDPTARALFTINAQPDVLNAAVLDGSAVPLREGDDPTTFTAYQNAMLDAITLRSTNIAAVGFNYSGVDALDGVTTRTFTFPLTDRFDINITQITLGLNLGILSLPQSVGPDSSGHALLIPDQQTWVQFLTAYHPARVAVDGGPGTGGGGELRARVAAAKTPADLDAISLT